MAKISLLTQRQNQMFNIFEASPFLSTNLPKLLLSSPTPALLPPHTFPATTTFLLNLYYPLNSWLEEIYFCTIHFLFARCV